MGHRKFTRNSTCTISFCIGYCAVWVYGITCLMIIFFEETCALGPLTVTAIGQSYECLLRNHVILALQQCECVDRIIFMHDDALPHIANPVKLLLKRHFRNSRIISRHLPSDWPLRSPDLNPCDFWLWNYLKDVIVSTPNAHFAELKARISQHILNVTPEIL